MEDHELGIVGLARMGMTLARNLASHGVRVAVFNRTRQRTDDFMASYGAEGNFKPAATLEELVHNLTPPRAILLMVKAGSPVDEGIDALSMLLEPGDTLIDGGISLFHDTRRRPAAAARAGLDFLGMGASGGEEAGGRRGGGGGGVGGGGGERGRGGGGGEWAVGRGVARKGMGGGVFGRIPSSEKWGGGRAVGILPGPAASHIHYDRDMGLV